MTANTYRFFTLFNFYFSNSGFFQKFDQFFYFANIHKGSLNFYVLGNAQAKAEEHDLPNLKVVVKKNGEFLSEGVGSAVQGNPLTAVAWLANTLGEFGIPFKAGEVILSGSLVPLEPVIAGDLMEMELEGIGSCSIKFNRDNNRDVF